MIAFPAFRSFTASLTTASRVIQFRVQHQALAPQNVHVYERVLASLTKCDAVAKISLLNQLRFVPGIAKNYFFGSARSVAGVVSKEQSTDSILDEAILLSSTIKKRRMKMNKHKLRKRKKALRMNTKVSRG